MIKKFKQLFQSPRLITKTALAVPDNSRERILLFTGLFSGVIAFMLFMGPPMMLAQQIADLGFKGLLAAAFILGPSLVYWAGLYYYRKPLAYFTYNMAALMLVDEKTKTQQDPLKRPL